MSPLYIDNPGTNNVVCSLKAKTEIVKNVEDYKLGVLERLSDIIIMPDDIENFEKNVEGILLQVKNYSDLNITKKEEEKIFSKYLNDLANISAKKIIIEGGNNKELTNRALRKLKDVISSSNLNNINDLRYTVTKILDIIGHDIIIYENEDGTIVDNVGNIEGVSKSTVNLKYSEAYKLIYDKGWFSDVLTEIENKSFIQEEKDLLKMTKFNTKDSDILELKDILKNYGTAEYIDNGITDGPILVIFPEEHGDQGIYNNYEAITENYTFFNFLATESMHNLEISGEDIKSVGNVWGARLDKHLKKGIKENKYIISSFPIEEFLLNKIKTIGVDHERITQIASLSSNKYNYKKDDIISLIKKSDDICKDKVNYSCTFLLEHRNDIWLNNIQKELINEEHENSKNIVALTCGGGHAKGLIEKSKEKGFKGVIYFKGNDLYL